MSAQVREIGKNHSDFKLFAANTMALDEFEKHGEAKFWVLEKQGVIVGHIMASLDRSLKTSRGFFGGFQCDDSLEHFELLLQPAIDYLKSLGCTQLVGPVDLSIFRNYRIQTKGFDAVAHPGEPRNPDFFESLFLRAGFKSLNHWKSWDFDKKVCQFFSDAMQAEAKQFESGLTAYQFKRYDIDNYEHQCRDLYDLIVDGFFPNFGGSRPTMDEFVSLFSQTKHIICTDASRLVYDKATNKLVGMSYACKIPESPQSIVYHSFAIDPLHRKSGIGQKIFAVALEETLKKYSHIVGALAKEGRTAYDKLGPHSREYHVFMRDL